MEGNCLQDSNTGDLAWGDGVSIAVWPVAPTMTDTNSHLSAVLSAMNAI